MINRRRVILGGLGLIGLAGGGWVVGHVALQTEIAAILHRRLGFLKLDPNGVRTFATDQTDAVFHKKIPTWNRLRYHLLAGSAPAFTASYGIADSSMEPQLEQLARLADDALYQAKQAGRDRAIVAGDKSVADGMPRRDIEHPPEMDLAKFAAEYGAGLGNNGDSRREAAVALLPLLHKANPPR